MKGIRNINSTIYKEDNYIINENESNIDEERIKYISFPIFDTENKDLRKVLALYTTRLGGYSLNASKGLNMKFELDDSKENVEKNYKLLADILDIDYERFTMSDQVHETNIMIVKEEDIGKGVLREKDYNSIDGLITNIKRVPLVTMYADCTPIYLYDKVNNVIAMAHGGWRGTVKGIASKIVDEMKKNFNSNPENITVVIGPSICKECYEVSDEVIDDIKILCKQLNINVSDKMIDDSNNHHVDLKEINKQVLISKNVKEENICVTNLCTKCREDLFYSHRRDGINRGSQAGIMMLL